MVRYGITMQTSQICKREFDSHRVFSTCGIPAHLKKTVHFGIAFVQHRGMKISKFGGYIINSESDSHWVLYTYISIKKCNGMIRRFNTGKIRYPLPENLALLSVEIQQIFEACQVNCLKLMGVFVEVLLGLALNVNILAMSLFSLRKLVQYLFNLFYSYFKIINSSAVVMDSFSIQ